MQHLITSIYALMEGSLEPSKFEDDCRDMFGISSYILFTMDKLIIQLAKQLQILITDDSCAKLLALYAYEGSRPRGSLEIIYHSNVLELLPEEDRCFRFEYSQVYNAAKLAREPFITDLISPRSHTFWPSNCWIARTSPNLWIFRLTRINGLSMWKTTSSQINPSSTCASTKCFFLGALLTNNAISDSTDVHCRNQRKWVKKGTNPLADVVVSNGLECKICLTTYRLFYVQDTHDFFYRRFDLIPSILIGRSCWLKVSHYQGIANQGQASQAKEAQAARCGWVWSNSHGNLIQGQAVCLCSPCFVCFSNQSLRITKSKKNNKPKKKISKNSRLIFPPTLQRVGVTVR